MLTASGMPAAAEYDNCFDSAITVMLPVPDGLVGAVACEAACQDNESCIAWNYRPHSFEPDTLPGICRLLPDIYQTSASDSFVCGRIER